MTEDEQRAYLEQAMSNSTSGYLLALDAANFSPEVGNQLIKEGLVGNFGGEQILSVEKAEGVREGFRAFVSMPMIEYKFGWPVFSGQEQGTFREADELVAIVYDGVYDGSEGRKFAVEA